MLVLLCFCPGSEFSVNKDLYKVTRVHLCVVKFKFVATRSDSESGRTSYKTIHTAHSCYTEHPGLTVDDDK